MMDNQHPHKIEKKNALIVRDADNEIYFLFFCKVDRKQLFVDKL